MSKPTPGPWKWYWKQENDEANCGLFREKEQGKAYSVCRAPRYQTKEQWEADANLISAAPDLLEAAKNAVSIGGCWYGDEDGCQKQCGHCQLTQAIAKAEGAE